MSRFVCVVSLLLLAIIAAQARHPHHDEPAETLLKVSGVQFTIPATWQALPAETASRVGHWLVPPPAGQPGEGVEIVVFFFGPGVGGGAQENIDAWAGTITAPDGSHPSATPQKRAVTGHPVTEVLLTGTYAQANPEPALPPTSKPGYALLGEVIENAGGNIYWRATGPAAQIAALAPVLDKAVDSLKPETAAPTASP